MQLNSAMCNSTMCNNVQLNNMQLNMCPYLEAAYEDGWLTVLTAAPHTVGRRARAGDLKDLPPVTLPPVT
eukprot:365048-Chlamydomonas_euryale.AAC.32